MRDYVDQIARLRECASNSHEVHLKCGAYLSGVCAKTRDIRMQDAADAIEELLAKVPKQGEWEHQELAPTNWTFCSVCGRQRSKKYKWYYCPSCGARMKGAEDGTTD